MEIARLGIAFAPLPCPTAGTTAPFSIAGAITQQNAEVLAALVLAELVQPGLPIIYCGRLAMMEPRTGLSVWGGVEMGMASAGTVQIGHRYGLPVNVYGFSTNAHSLDVQDGFERALNAAIPALAGADELSGIGEMEAGVMGSYAQMVADNEFAGSIIRIRKGIRCGLRCAGGGCDRGGDVVHAQFPRSKTYHEISQVRRSIYDKTGRARLLGSVGEFRSGWLGRTGAGRG